MDTSYSLTNLLQKKKNDSLSESNIYRPQFFSLSNPEDSDALIKLIGEKPHLKVYDAILDQLKNLVKSRNPKKILSDFEITEKINQKLSGQSLEYYGIWVYYPWSEKIVHILDKDEFIELRTDRNRYKITDEEEAELSTKKIGVIGLSVGQSVSLTLAMERSFGELRIADFDELEITNLNRLRSGIHNLGIKKTVLVAREIAEIDPFLNVVCFHEGITEDNLETFLTHNGKLDVLIDECDGVDVKIQCRIAAKKHHIPVLMEASDRGTIDIERFDLEPDRPILHGFIQHLDVSKLKDLKTSEEKIPYILPIAGIETLSPRMKASALEVAQTITTWPQLASAVTYGGGMTADICRRILLDQLHQSGRYFIDIEELISDPEETAVNITNEEVAPLTLEEVQTIVSDISLLDEDNLIQPDKTLVEQLVEAGSKAPSAGNNQPWKWYFDGKSLWLLHDKHRSVSFGDFENMASFIALGTALENLSLKAKELNTPLSIRTFPSNRTTKAVAQINFPAVNGKKESSLNIDELVHYINIRYTNRLKGDQSEIPENIISDLNNSVEPIDGAEFICITDKQVKSQLADIMATSERLRMFIPEGHYDLFEKELRWNTKEAQESKDGLDLDTFELTPTEKLGLRLAKDPKVAKYLRDWNAGKGLEKLSLDAVNTASAVGLVTMPAFTPQNCLSAGRAVERLWLTATKFEIGLQPMLAPLLHFNRIIYNKERTMPADIEEKFLELYEEFEKIFALRDKQVGLFLFRLTFSSEPETKSYRLPLQEIFYSHV